MFPSIKELHKSVTKLDTDFIRVYIIGDLQLGSIGCDFDLFKRVIKKINEEKAYVVFVGDLIDIGTPSDRKKIVSAGFYDTTRLALDHYAEEQLNLLMNTISSLKGRVLGIVRGHHSYEFSSGINVDQIIAQKLEVPYLDYIGVIFVYPKKEKKSEMFRGIIPCQIMAFHGAGGGRTPGGVLNRYEWIMGSFPSIDIYAIGHHSRILIDPVETIEFRLRSSEVVEKIRKTHYILVSGGYVDAFQANYFGEHKVSSYVERSGLRPQPLGPVYADIKFMRRRKIVDCATGKYIRDSYIRPVIEIGIPNLD